MTAPPPPPPPLPLLRITGGPGGIRANRPELEHLAARLGHDSEAVGADVVAVDMVRGDLGSPVFAGDFGAAGRLDAAGLWQIHELLGRASARLRSVADRLAELGHKVTSAAQGYPWGSSVLDAGILSPVDLLLGGTGVVLHGPRRGEGDAPVDLRPARVDAAANLLGLTTITSAGAPLADGPGVAVPTGSPHAVAAPRGLVDLVDGLAETDRHGGAGGIDVRLLVGADGTRRAVVDITGTRSWRPGGRNPADVTTNAMALVGRSGAYTHGVLAAMRRAGVRSSDPVMLVGHSQGGMVAVTVARDAARTGEFRVTHVVTAGSPISQTAATLPSSVRVLALENTRDVVPSLDGRPNPDRDNITTVRGGVPRGSVGAEHEVGGSYRPLAEATEQRGGRSVRDFLGSARGFFEADTAERHTFRVERR